MTENFVNPINFGIKADKIYYYREDISAKLDISIAELEAIGIIDGVIMINHKLIEPLIKVQSQLSSQGYDIVIKDGYRSPEVYKLAYEKRVIKDGLAETQKLLNMKTMPHASGLVVDLGLIDKITGDPIKFYDYKIDGSDAWFVDFYRQREDSVSQEYQKIQDLLIGTMLKYGFALGSKKEIWHFEF